MEQYILAETAWMLGRELRYDVAVIVRDGLVHDAICRSALPADAPPPLFAAILLLPGFINAHSHLEYCYCRRKLPRGAVDFPYWVDQIEATASGVPHEEKLAAARDGVAEMLRGGTTTIVDSVRNAEIAELLAASPLRHVLLWELLGLTRERASIALENVRRHVSRPLMGKAIAHGINPHAPYSVGAWLRGQIREWLAETPGLPCGWHLHETREEMDLFAGGRGPWSDYLEHKSLPVPFDAPPGITPTEFLKHEHLLDQCEVAFHLNHAEDSDFEQFAAPRAVVHCPGTHRYFEREPFPVARCLQNGANLCLGTDSLASGDTLSMLEMIRMMAEDHPALSGAQLVNLATLAPGRCRVLGKSPAPLGIIAQGAAADFAAIQTDLPLHIDLREHLLSPTTCVTATFIAGRQVY